MAERLRDKRCLIVGGTTGLGLATARRFLEEGAKLVISSRSVDKGAAAVDALHEHGDIHFFAGDAECGASFSFRASGRVDLCESER